MTQLPSEHPTTDDHELLVAYLDGELDAATAERVERRLAEDDEFRRQLRGMQEAWDLLDDLPQTTLDEKFTRTTVEMVAVKLSHDLHQEQTSRVLARALRRTTPWAAILLCALAGFALTRFWQTRQEQQLLSDLPVIERIEEYRDLDSFEFLQALADTDLFNTELEQETTREEP
jgi:anti-sigma factor RsiW